MDVATIDGDHRTLLQAGLDHLDQGITVVDGDLRLVGWNRRFIELLDFPPEMVRVGTLFEDFLRFNAERGEYGPGAVADLVTDRVRTAQAFVPHLIERTRPNGVILSIQGAPLAGGGFVTVYTDVTERRRAEGLIRAHSDELESRVSQRTVELSTLNEELRKSIAELQKAEAALRDAQKMAAIGQLAGGLAHDFNNLLTVVIGNLHSLKNQVDADLSEAYIEPAIRAGDRGVDITRRLLAFARRQPLDLLAVDVEQIMSRTTRLLRGSLPSSIAIACSAERGLWPACADPNQLESALVNLALNARDAMPNGGRLTLHVANRSFGDGAVFAGHPVGGQYVQISVSDTGSGIDAGTLSRAFEPFVTTKPFGMGSGLGLSMVYGFVRQSGGQIAIDSEVSKGTCVSFLLPRAAAVAAPVAAAVDDRPHPRPRGELVLLVEDDDPVRLVIRRELLELGYNVIEARDGVEGEGLLKAVQDIQVLVSDVAMPGGISGTALAGLAHRARPEVRVVLISGFIDAEAGEIRCLEDVAFLPKPFDREQLLRAIEGWE